MLLVHCVTVSSVSYESKLLIKGHSVRPFRRTILNVGEVYTIIGDVTVFITQMVF